MSEPLFFGARFDLVTWTYVITVTVREEEHDASAPRTLLLARTEEEANLAVFEVLDALRVTLAGEA